MRRAAPLFRGAWLGGVMRVVGVVLAAGESRRMGRLKALLPFGSHTVIEHVLQPLLQADLAAVAVVLARWIGPRHLFSPSLRCCRKANAIVVSKT